MYTGLSLSFCVRDIVNGLVSLSQVDKIIAATAASTPEVWDEVLANYRESYWTENPDECEQLARKLIKAGKVKQPRLQGKEAHNIADGHWLLNGNKVRL